MYYNFQLTRRIKLSKHEKDWMNETVSKIEALGKKAKKVKDNAIAAKESLKNIEKLELKISDIEHDLDQVEASTRVVGIALVFVLVMLFIYAIVLCSIYT